MTDTKALAPLCVGLHYGIPDDEYFAHAAVSNSLLKAYGRSPAHCLHAMQHASETTDAMLLGRATHCATLEPDHYETRFEAVDRRTAALKAAAAVNGVTLLTPAQDRTALELAAAARSEPTARALLAHGEAEVVGVWEDPETGVLCRCKMDWINTVHAAPIILDLKTTQDASPRGFARSCGQYGYHRQAAMYSDGYHAITGQMPHFVFLAIETSAPFVAALYLLSPEDIEHGRAAYQHDLRGYADSVATGEWPGYTQGIESLELPEWAKGQP